MFRKFILSITIFCTVGLLLLTFYHSPRPYLTVIGPVKMADGIGRQAPELINALCDDIDIGFIPTNKICLNDIPANLEKYLTPNKNYGEVIIYEEPLPTPDQKFYRRLNQRLKKGKQKHQIRIAYSMYEYSFIPDLWVEALNTYFDAVAVPDEFLVDVYKSSGVKAPIFVLPLALGLEPFLNEPLKSSCHNPFCFINTSSLIPRKNHEALILAFYNAFGNNPNVQLLLNYRYQVGDCFEKTSELIKSLNVNNIILQNAHLNSEEYLQFLKKGDIFVSLSKGEGFSIQPREAMALGMPVIISNNTAHKTIVSTGLASGISCLLTEAAYNPFLKCSCGESYIPDIDEMTLRLKDAYQNYDKYLMNGDQRRAWAKQYTFEQLKPLYLSLIKPKKVTLGDTNIILEDELITSSVDLYKKMSNLLLKKY